MTEATDEEFLAAMTEWQNQYFQERGWLDIPRTVAGWREFFRDLYDWTSRFCREHNYPTGQKLQCSAQLPDGKVSVTVYGCVLEHVEGI